MASEMPQDTGLSNPINFARKIQPQLVEKAEHKNGAEW